MVRLEPRLNVVLNLGVNSLAPTCKLRKHNTLENILHNLHAQSYHETNDCTIVR